MAVTVAKSAALPAGAPAPKRVSILGSTGSVGCNTVDLIEREPDAFKVEVLTAYSNVALLADQARRLESRLAVIGDPALYDELKQAMSGSATEVAAGRDALIEAAGRPADRVVAAIVGAAGLEPTLAAVRQGGVVALANKECLVCAGDLVMREVRHHGTTLLPVDSEHNAIFQVFDFDRADAVERIILTASGGPFWTLDAKAMAGVTPDEPDWRLPFCRRVHVPPSTIE